MPSATLTPASGDLQPRDRAGRSASDAQITHIAANLDPARLHSSPEADRGAPIVGPDNVVESGNGRVAAINQAYAAGRGADYRKMITDQGHVIPDGMVNPMLVRRRTTELSPEDRRSFVQEANQSATQRLSAPEQAASDSRSLTPELLNRYNPDLTGGALAAGNRDFIRGWVNTLPEPERNSVMDPQGALSAEGLRRLHGAMLARAYGDKGTLARSLESTDDNTKAVTGAMVDAAPAWAKLQAGIAAGKIPQSMDVSKDLIRAVELVSQARERGHTAASVLDQQDAFNPVSAVTAGFVRAMHNPGMTRPASRPTVADILRRYAHEAEKQSTSAGLFGADDKATPERVLDAVRQSSAAANDPSQTQGRLMAEDGSDTLDANEVEDPLAQTSADALANRAPPAGFDPGVRGNLPHDPHFSNRPSNYLRDTFEALGVADPEGAVSRPAPVQIHLLKQGVVDKYGLKQIVVAPKANPRETIDQLADAHHNLQYMTYAMGIPNSAIGLRGTLSLWLGPRDDPKLNFGGTQALGIYNPGERRIYIPGRSNSFAHEWTHALDHALVGQLTSGPTLGPLLSMTPTQWHAAPANTSAGAFARVMTSMFGKDVQTTLDFLDATARLQAAATPNNKAALARAQARFQATDYYRYAAVVSKNYLAQPYEMLARSHEAYLSARVIAANGTTEFVAKTEITYLTEAAREFAVRYPKGDERQTIFAAWDNLHDQLKLDALYPGGIPAVLPAHDLVGFGPAHWGQWSDAAANPALAAALKAQVNAGVAQVRTLRESLQDSVHEGLHRVGINADEGSDPGYLTRRVRAMDTFRAATFSPRGMMHTILARVPQAAKGPTRELIDHLTTDPGSGRHVGQTYEEAVHHHTRADLNGYAVIAQRHGLISNNLNQRSATMSPADRDQLITMMTQQDDTRKYPANLEKAIRDNTINKLSAADQALLRAITVRAAPAGTSKPIAAFAADLRFVLDQRHYDLRQAGFNVPYVSGYWPRVMDDHRVFAEPDAFERDARRALAIRSERETEADGEELVSRFKAHEALLDPARADAIGKAIRAERKRIKAAVTAAAAPGAAAVAPADTFRAEDLVPDAAMRADINNAWAQARAKIWRQEIMVGHPTKFDTRGPNADALKGRVMPPEADAILRPWYVTDPHAAIPGYLHQTNRKIAFAKRFDATGKVIDDALTAAGRGGMRPEDVTEMRRLVEMVTGRPQQSQAYPRALVRGLEMMHAYGTIALMPRAVFSAFSEPIATFAHTMSVRTTYEAFAQTARDIVRTGDAQRIAEIANYLGVVSHSAFESVQADRTDATYTDSQKLGPMVVNFFRRTGLTALTNSQRRGGIVSGSIYLHSLADTILGRGPKGGHAERRSMADAHAQLRNLTIPDKDHEDFARWLSAYDNVPDIEALEGNANGEHFAHAIGRFVDQVNQDPKTSEKAMLTQDPFGRLIFSLMGFNYGFQGNVIDAYFKNAHRKIHEDKAAGASAGARAGLLGKIGLQTIGTVAAMWGVSLISTVVREAVFNGVTWDEKKKNGELVSWLLSLAFQRTGLNGTLDPVMQALNGLKYDKSIAGLALGAYPGYFAANAMAVLNPFLGKTSPDTNTAKYNAWIGAFNLAVPLAAEALTALPGGPVVNGLAAAALMKGTSKSAADGVAGFMVGQKGASEGPAPRHPPRPEPPAPRAPGKQKDADNAGLRNAALNVADDFLPAMIKTAGKVPLAGKVVAGVAAAGYAASRLADDFTRYGQPPPGNKR